jgi:hypothetical protein
LRERTKEGEAVVARCDGLAVAMASLQVKFDANYIECNGLNATNKRLEKRLRLRTKDAEDTVVRGDGLELSMASLQGKLDAKCVEFNYLKARYRIADNELTSTSGFGGKVCRG